MADRQRETTRTFVQRHQTPPSTGWSLGATIDLPPDLLAQATRRLRALSALFAFTFLMIGFVPALFGGALAQYLLGSPARWIAGLSTIVLALGVFGLTFLRQVPPQTLVAVAGLFEIVGSYGIAFAEYQGFETGITQQGRLGGFGLSWVSLFVVLVSVIVPTPPRRAAVTAAIAVTSVPVAFLVARATGNMPVAVAPDEFSAFLVFPYAFVVVIAYIGARVVYHLGTQVQRAREMGSYQLIERLGEGGMGEVWRAEHRLLARPAAIKLIRAEMLGGGDAGVRRTVLSRFQREARATAAMRSAHTVQIFDYGVTDAGEFYYVMELLEGLDADSLVQRHGPLPAERVVYLLRQICESLAEAHEQGLIHRDIKPANVYVCRYGREVDFVKVLDFGLVTASRDGGGPEIRLTADNAISGTPAYMAPERVLGNRPVDGRADIYAVGCLAYYVLTGRLVFEGATAIEALMQHVEAAPIPPSRITEVPLPAELERLVLECLAKDPERRPASADALAALLAGVPLERPWTPERAREWWDTHVPRSPRPAVDLA